MAHQYGYDKSEFLYLQFMIKKYILENENNNIC